MVIVFEHISIRASVVEVLVWLLINHGGVDADPVVAGNLHPVVIGIRQLVVGKVVIVHTAVLQRVVFPTLIHQWIAVSQRIVGLTAHGISLDDQSRRLLAVALRDIQADVEIAVTVAGVTATAADKLALHGLSLLYHLTQTLHIDHHVVFSLTFHNLNDVRYLRLLSGDEKQTERRGGVDRVTTAGPRGVLLHEAVLTLQSVDSLDLVLRDALRLIAITRQLVEGRLGLQCLSLREQRKFHTLMDILTILLIMHGYLSRYGYGNRILCQHLHWHQHHQHQGETDMFQTVAHFNI